MRRLVSVVLPVLLLGTTAVVYAAAERHATAELTSLSSNGVSGNVDLIEQQVGGTLVKVQAKNLQPNTEYLATWYANRTCQVEATTDQNIVGRFRTNPQGVALFNGKLANKGLADIGSVSVRLATDMSVVGCAGFTQ